jgi:DnaJ-class molecular chaperone
MKLCGSCNGSGEGLFDRTKCKRCNGSGEFWQDDNEHDEPEDESEAES